MTAGAGARARWADAGYEFTTETNETEADPAQGPLNTNTAKLLQLIADQYDTVMDTTGGPHLVPRNGPRIAVPVKSSATHARLAAAFHDQYAKTIGKTALADVINVVEGRAWGVPPVDLPLRSDPRENGIVLDLGGADGACIMLDETGWRLKDVSPLIFRRTRLTGALPIPRRGGSLDQLREIVNVGVETWPLLVAWQVNQLLGKETPIATFTGEAGTGKSTAAAIMTNLTDQSPVPLRSPPRDLQNWIVSASGSRVVTLDNLSNISQWLADALCRAVTGEGLVQRQLYTDHDIAVLTLRRAVILTSIDNGAIRGDLAERMLPLELKPIPDTSRLTDDLVQTRWANMHAEVLGGLLDLAVKVLQVFPDAQRKLTTRPRMAGFAETLFAVDLVLGTQGLPSYLRLLQALKSDVVDGDTVAQALIEFMSGKQNWTGTPTQLFDKLSVRSQSNPPDWPTTPAELGKRIASVMSPLREQGFEVDKQRSGQKRAYTLRDLNWMDHSDADDHDDVGPE